MDVFEEITFTQYLIEKPSAYLDELKTKFQDHTRVVVSVATPHKKLRHFVMCHSQDSNTELREGMANVNAAMIVWIDETRSDHCDAGCCYGYPFSRITPVSYTLSVRGKWLSDNLISSKIC